jgi:hypothetical protein
MQRLEIALYGHGFQNDNSIGEGPTLCFVRLKLWTWLLLNLLCR